MNGSEIAVPLLLGLAGLGLCLWLLPTPVLAGRLLQAGQLSEDLTHLARRRRVAPLVPVLLSVMGIGLGLATGALLAQGAGQQGWLLGGALALAGALWPRTRFTQGWDARFVKEINADTAMALRMVYILSGVGHKPVDEAVRAFAHAWGGQSVLADLLLECPATLSPVQFLGELPIPGQAYAMLILALRQAQEVPEKQRRLVLWQQFQTALDGIRNTLRAQAKRRAQTMLMVGVVTLLSTLLLTILAPLMLNLVEFLQ